MFEGSILGSSVKALDKYIESKEQYFLIRDKYNIIYNKKFYDINFIISNKIEVGKQIVSTRITMTEFKKIYNEVHNDYDEIVNYKNYLSPLRRTYAPIYSVAVFDFIEIFFEHFKNNVKGNVGKSEIIFFENPISINAQSSNNRKGYGNEYYYDILIYEGTKYGETSQYPIVGYIYTYNKEETKRFC